MLQKKDWLAWVSLGLGKITYAVKKPVELKRVRYILLPSSMFSAASFLRFILFLIL